MAVAFHNLNSDSGLKKLDEYLLARSYITGYQASKDDITVYSYLAKSPSAEYVNASRWYKHIDALLRISGVSGEGAGVIVEGSAPITEAVATPPVADSKASAAEEEDDDDDVDLFGEETEEEKKAAEERAAALKASGKKKESGKSSVLMDVKPWDDETDMKKLEEAVRSVHMEGLTYGLNLFLWDMVLRSCKLCLPLWMIWSPWMISLRIILLLNLSTSTFRVVTLLLSTKYEICCSEVLMEELGGLFRLCHLFCSSFGRVFYIS